MKVNSLRSLQNVCHPFLVVVQTQRPLPVSVSADSAPHHLPPDQQSLSRPKIHGSLAKSRGSREIYTGYEAAGGVGAILGVRGLFMALLSAH